MKGEYLQTKYARVVEFTMVMMTMMYLIKSRFTKSGEIVGLGMDASGFQKGDSLL
ncbi:hypothetical protein PMI05_04613 [Brevibacillus sp. BC25]|nr:hypothetical protein PMI05_04613 [Brevibacillus sp. BC25]